MKKIQLILYDMNREIEYVPDKIIPDNASLLMHHWHRHAHALLHEASTAERYYIYKSHVPNRVYRFLMKPIYQNRETPHKLQRDHINILA